MAAELSKGKELKGVDPAREELNPHGLRSDPQQQGSQSLVLNLLDDRARTDYSWEKSLEEGLYKNLALTKSAAEQHEFVKRFGTGIIIANPGESVPPWGLASPGQDGIIYFNREKIGDFLKELERSGKSQSEASAILASELLPTLVHEIRHLMLDQKIKQALGASFQVALLEIELIPLYDEVGVIKELGLQDSSLITTNSSLCKAAEKGAEELRRYLVSEFTNRSDDSFPSIGDREGVTAYLEKFLDERYSPEVRKLVRSALQLVADDSQYAELNRLLKEELAKVEARR